MKRITFYRFEDGDVPSPKQIDEAFNLLYEFAPALRAVDHPVHKAFNKVVANKEFTRADAVVLVDYGYLVARSARERYSLPKWDTAPWRDAILQACDNLNAVVVGLENLYARRSE